MKRGRKSWKEMLEEPIDYNYGTIYGKYSKYEYGEVITKNNYEDDLFELQKTRKVKVDEYTEISYTQHNYNEDLWKAVKEKEDLEEKLGIDLITLFKALKNGVYYKYKSYGYYYKISKCRKCVLTGNKTLIVDRHTYKYLCDYGKTWALDKKELTREELEYE